MRIAIFRKAHFNAAHRLHNPAWSDAKNKETGKSYNAQAAHLWTLNEGKITAFQQYVDTKKLADAENK